MLRVIKFLTFVKVFFVWSTYSVWQWDLHLSPEHQTSGTLHTPKFCHKQFHLKVHWMCCWLVIESNWAIVRDFFVCQSMFWSDWRGGWIFSWNLWYSELVVSWLHIELVKSDIDSPVTATRNISMLGFDDDLDYLYFFHDSLSIFEICQTERWHCGACTRRERDCEFEFVRWWWSCCRHLRHEKFADKNFTHKKSLICSSPVQLLFKLERKCLSKISSVCYQFF